MYVLYTALHLEVHTFFPSVYKESVWYAFVFSHEKVYGQQKSK